MGAWLFLGFPAALTDMTLDLYENLMRSIKFGTVYGKPAHYFNGCGQGDLCSLFPAIALVSGQFFMVDMLYPSIRMGAQIDDRNFRGPLQAPSVHASTLHDPPPLLELLCAQGGAQTAH